MRRKGVALWKFLLGCVRLVDRYMENQLPPQVVTRLPPFTPKGSFHLYVHALSREKERFVEPVTPRSRIL